MLVGLLSLSSLCRGIRQIAPLILSNIFGVCGLTIGGDATVRAGRASSVAAKIAVELPTCAMAPQTIEAAMTVHMR